MQFTKKIIFNNTVNAHYNFDTAARQLRLLGRHNNDNKALVKGRFAYPILLSSDNRTALLLKKPQKPQLVSIIQKNVLILEKMFFLNNMFLQKLHMIGLGYKNFVLDGRLFILVGDCNYIIFDIPTSVKVFCRKNQIYILSIDNNDALTLLNEIKKIKKPNFYKGKGVLEFKNFKFTKLKVGKKQRFM